MTRELRPRTAVAQMKAYSPPQNGRSGKLRLDFNENTVGCSPAVIAAITSAVTGESLSMYPEYVQARGVVSSFLGINENQMTFTNGTDEAIQLLFNTFVEAGSEVLVLAPSYAMYRFYAELAGAIVRQVEYKVEDDLAFPLQAVLEAIGPNTRAVCISNPNNPTGTPVSEAQLRAVIEAAPDAAVLVDEAYVEFSGITAMGWLAEYPQLFVSRTFSKAFGMAGIRCGCLCSQEQNITWLRKAQSPYSVNVVAVVAAVAAVSDVVHVRHYVDEVLAARSLVEDGLSALGLRWYTSAGNFILFNVGSRASTIRDELKQTGILIRDRSYEISGCVRVTIGTRAQMKQFLNELEKTL
ncbi:MAG: histidinol-phosphate transaminase [Ilumatobacteraceae bacterium]